MLGKDTLDSLRMEVWHKAHRTVQELEKKYKRGKGRPSPVTKNLKNIQ